MEKLHFSVVDYQSAVGGVFLIKTATLIGLITKIGPNEEASQVFSTTDGEITKYRYVFEALMHLRYDLKIRTSSAGQVRLEPSS